MLMELRPSQIVYSQDSILNRFGDYTRHAKMCIGETLDHLLVGRCNVNHGQLVRVHRGGVGGRIWRNWKPQRPISNTVKSYQPSFYLNRSDASSGNSFTRRFTTIRDNVSYSYKQVKHGTHLTFHSNSSQNCDSLFPVS
jgi:hypothetical protein